MAKDDPLEDPAVVALETISTMPAWLCHYALYAAELDRRVALRWLKQVREKLPSELAASERAAWLAGYAPSFEAVRDEIHRPAAEAGRRSALAAIARGELFTLGRGLVRRTSHTCPACMVRFVVEPDAPRPLETRCSRCGGRAIRGVSAGCVVTPALQAETAAYNRTMLEYIRREINPSFDWRDVRDESAAPAAEGDSRR